MKMVKRIISTIVIASMGVFAATAQDSTATESKNGFDTGLDIYSSYPFRGVKFGTGPAFQPWVKYTYGGLTVGSWGSISTGADEAPEMDLYASYAFDSGPSLGLSVYYYSGNDWTNYSLDTAGAHGLELNAGYTFKAISLSANYIPLQSNGAATQGGDTYVQVGYQFEKVKVFAGAGNGWHTTDGEFNAVNIGLTTVKNVEITDKFTLPVTGSVVVNPDRKEMYIAVGLSL